MQNTRTAGTGFQTIWYNQEETQDLGKHTILNFSEAKWDFVKSATRYRAELGFIILV